ncbi:MAG: T9SS type A sorting domain-containing protein [Ignavibacteriae bacterium]|nr:T9SS type A sorting domain-containing protein [Ignavibacteriota bacterium]
MKVQNWLTLAALCAVGILLMGNTPVGKIKGRPASVLNRGDYVVMDANNIATYIRNNGSFNRNPGTGNAGFEWPKGTGNTANYASGLWIGGKRGGVVRVAVAEYAYEFDAGPIATGVNPLDARWRVYKIVRGNTASDDYKNWPGADGAPYTEKNGITGYQSVAENPANPDEPLLIGDATIFCVFNDNNQALHTNMNTLPVGVEVQLTAFAFNRSDALGNNIFYKWKFINKSGQQIDSAFVTVWTDIDLGDSGDDFDGCDTTIGLGFTYNSDPDDGVYGTAVPATGFDFLQGPLVPGLATDTARFPNGRTFPGKKLLKMTSFIKYNNDATDLGNPDNGQEVFNYMKGVTRSGQLIRDYRGRPTSFMFSGDPTRDTTGGNYVEVGAGGDRRFMMSAGPFTMAPNDTQEIVAANLIAVGTDYKNSVVALKNADKQVQTAYELDFKLAAPPPTPIVDAVESSNEIVLSWGRQDSLATVIENTVTLDPLAQAGGAADFTYNFEGYVVYQFPNASFQLDQAKVVSTFDAKVNPEHPEVPSPGLIYDDVFKPELGGLVNIPVKFGNNNGVQRSIRITRDLFTNLALANAKDYYYGVSAYSYSKESVPKTLESAVATATVRPTKLFGTRTQGSYGDTVKAVTHSAGISEAKVIPRIINPAALTGHNYQITIDTVGGTQKWKLRDATAAKDVLTSANFGPSQGGTDYSWPEADGIEWATYDVETRPNPDASSFSLGSTDSWLFAARWSNIPPAVVDPTNDGGHGVITPSYDLPNFLGQVAPAFDARNAVPIEVRFGPGITQKAYRLRRAGGNGTTYVIQQTNPFVDVPFQVWDISNSAAPRQLTVSWRDQDNNAVFNPPAGSDDGLEIAFIYFRTYNPAGGQWPYQGDPVGINVWSNAATASATSDIMYGMSFGLVTGKTPWTQSKITVTPFKLLKPADSYAIVGPAAPAKSVGFQKSDLASVNAVPNPYFGASAYERNQFNRVVRFTNLPPNARVRVFNLAGELIRSLDNAAAGGNTTLDWDLTNRNELPVASGIYIVHVEADGLGSKILKVAVIMSEERLDNF